ncbi:hypothetical protein Droror1_Dr00003328 [Drosera rotundifolia]
MLHLLSRIPSPHLRGRTLAAGDLLSLSFFSTSATMMSPSLLLTPTLEFPRILRGSDYHYSSVAGFGNGIRRVGIKNVGRMGRVLMSVTVGSKSGVVEDGLFSDYKSSSAFFFPGQGAQSVGMGAEAQSVLPPPLCSSRQMRF